MGTPLTDLTEDFETASTLSPEMRACYVVTAFTQGTFASFFDLNQFRVSLAHNEDLGEYIMELELLPEASEQDKNNFLETKMTFAESLAAIDHNNIEGEGDAVSLHIETYAEEGFVLMTPDLKDFVTLYDNISGLYDLNWDDPKFCAEIGHDYSLADIKQALALIPEKENEEEMSPMDRPVNMGLPRVWLQ